MSEPERRPGWRPFESVLPLRAKDAIRDGLAGVQLAAMNIPQALGYTKIAGTPVITGLYTLLLPPAGFAALGSSRYLVVAADSATAAILFGGLTRMAPIASPRYVELASAVALLTALFLLIARLLKLGFLADFLSRTVLVGFLTGVGFQVGIAVLGEMLGIEVTAHRTIRQLFAVVSNLAQVHGPTVALSAAIVGGVLLLERISSKMPGALLAVVAAILASRHWDFAAQGIKVVGSVAGGLPRLTFPDVAWKDVETLIGLAGSCFVMILAQSAATARFYGMRHDETVDENADLLGLSAANALAGLSGTFTVNGSPTQTAMVESSGGRSQFAQLSTSVVVALVLLFLSAPLQYLPRCVLGSIVFLIAIKLIDLRKLASIRQESPGEFALAVITAIVVVVVGVEQGIVLAMVLSLARIVRHSYRPHTGVLVADGDLYWRLADPAPGATTEPGLVIYRFGAPLFYANAPFFAEEVRAILTPSPAVKWLLVDAEAMTNLDYSAARVVCDLLREIRRTGVTVAFARVSPYLKSDFERHHVTDEIPPELLFPRLRDALDAFAKSGTSVAPAQPGGV